MSLQLNLESDSIAYPKFRKYLDVLEDVITVKLDSTIIPVRYIMVHNHKSQRGYETVLDLKGQNRGPHVLSVTRKRIRRDSIRTTDVARIPFWYYPD